ncbi:phytanoyl-CoA dioxygenase family protein [Nocardia sp. NPDC057663]|uniref:phytanoyl-CoA dioxygenase family protein n=1 Tax=Nocardia sp. NPDC057663 TaxID=3346201 RepID=UPI0036714B5B
MNTSVIPVDDTDTDRFDRDGFAVVPELFTAAELNRYRQAALDFMDQGNRFAEVGLVRTTDAWEQNDILRELALHPRLGAVAERLAGRPLRIWGGEIMAKLPHEQVPSHLHDDLSASMLGSTFTLNAWVALVDVPVQRGAMIFLPGSHRRSGPERVPFGEIELGTYMTTTWPELEWSPRVTVPLRAGGVTFHQNRTAHAAGTNSTDVLRLAFAVTFADAETATYQPLPGHDFLPMRVGEPIDPERYPRVGSV